MASINESSLVLDVRILLMRPNYPTAKLALEMSESTIDSSFHRLVKMIATSID